MGERTPYTAHWGYALSALFVMRLRRRVPPNPLIPVDSHSVRARAIGPLSSPSVGSGRGYLGVLTGNTLPRRALGPYPYHRKRGYLRGTWGYLGRVLNGRGHPPYRRPPSGGETRDGLQRKQDGLSRGRRDAPPFSALAAVKTPSKSGGTWHCKTRSYGTRKDDGLTKVFTACRV